MMYLLIINCVNFLNTTSSKVIRNAMKTVDELLLLIIMYYLSSSHYTPTGY
jgi:hypothetical protein